MSKIKIASIDAMVTRLPILNGDWRDADHRATHIEFLIVDVTTDEGLVGTGFSHTSGPGAKTLESLVRDTLAPHLIGLELSPRRLWQDSWKFLHNLGGTGVSMTALGAIDIALWDIVAKDFGRPLVELLGRVHQQIPVYGSGVNLGKTLDELLEEVKSWRDAGYRGIKMKVGKPDIAEDVERVTKVREIIGALPLMVDANQRWGPELAQRRIKALEGMDLTWVEEPLLSDDISGHARLSGQISTAIGAGENLYNTYQFRDYLTAGALDYVQADIPRVGGITAYLGIAALAQAFNRPMAPHGVPELSGQILCALPNAYMAEEVEGGSLTSLKALTHPMPVVDGYFTPSMAPGHGLDFNREYLEQCRI